MINADTIPEEFIEAACKILLHESKRISAPQKRIKIKYAIAAAINAWPEMEARPTFTPSRIILPLPQGSD